jgi:hypothetical protein
MLVTENVMADIIEKSTLCGSEAYYNTPQE